ncbi:sensor histidine kinase [Heliorestis convoluta]|uniref:histidine kinase n=1 Tax=Heliorestis convoluta TaxID=356322 RepID=A0A5Q2MVN0_9FIRM|nr:HAMP domain-containing sensor histidine kinase [Heliorestis convoluta]QGG46257.1 Integral membrane sensor signal transduction histidine kinase [Heliorestis convoluta]
MKFWQSLVFKIWIMMVFFSLALLGLMGAFFYDLLGTYTMQRETRELASRAALVGVEKDLEKAAQLSHSISVETGALVLFGSTKGDIDEVFAYGISPLKEEMTVGKQRQWGRWHEQETLMGPRVGREQRHLDHTLLQPNGVNQFFIPVTAEESQQLERGHVVSRKGELPFLEVSVLAVFVPILESDQVWRVVYILAPLQPITQDLEQLQAWILSAALFLLLLSGIVAFLLSRKVARPLTLLHGAAEEMRKGKFQHSLPVQGRDEIGRLGQTLNTLSKELSDSLQQLEEKNEQLAQGMQSMRDLAANVSHDLRTPMFLIQGYAEALRDDMARTAQERQEMAEIILSETERMERLVEDLMELARLESGYFRFEMEKILPYDLIKETCRRMEGMAKERHILLQPSIIDRIDTMKEIRADGGRLEQALMNLIDNGLRHTPPGGQVTVTLTMEKKAVLFSVNDTGSGLSAEDVPRVWERFYRGDKSRNRKTDASSGLGLAIVKAIVEGHRGQVGLENRPGQGASFYFRIPKNL